MPVCVFRSVVWFSALLSVSAALASLAGGYDDDDDDVDVDDDEGGGGR